MKTICRLAAIGFGASLSLSVAGAQAAKQERPATSHQRHPPAMGSMATHANSGLGPIGVYAGAEQRGNGMAAPEGSARGFASVPLGGHRYELTFSGREFISRDRLEGHLLYRAARVARDRGYNWFTLLHLPGERGAEDHSARRNPSFGAAYGHWQPHWTYQLSGREWQPWHPEWGAAFWADAVPRREIERFEVHAIIEGRRGAYPANQPMAFNTGRIIQGLRRDFQFVGASAP